MSTHVKKLQQLQTKSLQNNKYTDIYVKKKKKKKKKKISWETI